MSKGIIIPEKMIERVAGTAVPLPEDDQDTDKILPQVFLKKTSFKDMGKYAYFSDRYDSEGKPIQSHPLNDPKYEGARILIAGANYGCGSSREHAPQGLLRWGISGIIAESYADIFAGNCASIGIVGVTVPAEKVAELADLVAANPSTQFEMDLQAKVMRFGENVLQFEMQEGRRQAFLRGTWDMIPVLMQYMDEIKAAEARIPYLHFK